MEKIKKRSPLRSILLGILSFIVTFIVITVTINYSIDPSVHVFINLSPYIFFLSFFSGYYVFRKTKPISQIGKTKGWIMLSLVLTTILIVSLFSSYTLKNFMERQFIDLEKIVVHNLKNNASKKDIFFNKLQRSQSIIKHLENELSFLLDSQKGMFNRLFYYIGDKNERREEINDSLYNLSKNLPIQYANLFNDDSYGKRYGKVRLKQYGRYSFLKKEPSFDAENIKNIYANEELEVLRPVVSAESRALIKKDFPYFDGNFEAAYKEFAFLNHLQGNANSQLDIWKYEEAKRLMSSGEIYIYLRKLENDGNPASKSYDRLKKYKKQHKENWLQVRHGYEEGYMHTFQLSELKN